MRAPRLHAAALLILLLPSVARADVAEFLGRPIQAVRLEREGRETSDPALLRVVQTRPGAVLSMAAVRETITHLVAIGFENVVVHAAGAAAGVALRYELFPARIVGGFSFSGIDGIPGLDEGRLRQVIGERFGQTPAIARGQEIVDTIVNECRRRGYLRATATVTPVADAGGRTQLAFAVQPGPRASIGEVTVTGLSGDELGRLRERLGLERGGPYEIEALQLRIDDYIAASRRRGHYEARVGVTPRVAADDGAVDLAIAVDLGPRVRVVFTGDPLPANRRNELVPIAEEGSADEDLLEDASNRIANYLRSLGYRDGAAKHVRRRDGDELTIEFAVTRGRQYRVSQVDIEGNAALSMADIESALKVRAGQPFAQTAVDGDVAALQDRYRRAGFASARVTASVETAPGAEGRDPVPVVVRVVIAEQVQTLVGSVTIRGGGGVPEAEVLPLLGLQPGAPFFATQLAIDRDTIESHFANSGFQRAAVEGNPGISADGSRADVVFTVDEGRRVFVNHVLIVGNERTRRETIERELQFRPGDPLSVRSIGESQRRLATLQLFRRTRFLQLGHGDEARRDVLVVVEEAPVTTLGYGGGLEVRPRIRRADSAAGAAAERIEFAPRAFFEVGRRNLFGKNRSINLFTRLSVRTIANSVPDRTPIASDGGFDFSEYRVLGTFREPRVFSSRADAFLTATLEQQIRSSFKFSRRAFNAEVVRRLSPAVSFSGNYQIQRIELFDEQFTQNEQVLIDRLFPQVRLSSFSSAMIRDTRDDPVNPEGGQYLSANAQLAARQIGSEVGLAKSYVTAQAFRPLPGAGRVVFAASARAGLATGFPRTVVTRDRETGEPITATVRALPASERFFAGGDTTVRGFALDQLGTPETIDEFGFPIGGNAVVLFNAELRVPVRGGLGVVGFFDTGNVFARTSGIDLTELRSAVGFGVRYRSPVGPIRVDVGFKTDRRDIVPGRRESASALHISLGQAF